MWDIVANRLYYAALHAALALLINDGHKTTTHRGIVALFGLHYIKTGIFTTEEGKMYSRLQTMRDESDRERDMDIRPARSMMMPMKLIGPHDGWHSRIT